MPDDICSNCGVTTHSPQADRVRSELAAAKGLLAECHRYFWVAPGGLSGDKTMLHERVDAFIGYTGTHRLMAEGHVHDKFDNINGWWDCPECKALRA